MRRHTVVFLCFLLFSSFGFSGEEAAENARVLFKPPSFLAGAAFAKVESECSMLEELQASLVSSANDFGLEIEFLGEKANTTTGRFVQVDLVEVNGNVWRFGALRPHSNAKYRVSIFDNGQLVRSDERALNSSVAIGTCARLEKISKAFGRPIMKWVFLNIRGDDVAFSSSAILESNDAMAIREVARKLYNNADFNESLLDAAAQKIWSEKNTKDKLMTDALAWLCKYIGASKNPRYRSFLESLEASLKRGKLKKYAKSALKNLPDVTPSVEPYVVNNEVAEKPKQD
ncbi:hypothetical protein [Marinagarivorans cellulosilyticus]|uniref:Uncharacterized protein n=1 Tax=Marinagarivorans cellulosilyticus TaxID=2721545 RepID=A0AAN1WLE4_9GAMM|nr:hypothetical protein [Marinagarivorans cellulosilyticus]BCD99742.1 hypothetical protein MARGE09_P3944 [Marinagarivorans cellulosilyticus]